MTQSPNHPVTQSPSHPITNPYVGPRTFTEKEQRFFFGREREARDLTARIVSERLLLFYAQSGAGKSSLLNARVIPRLRDEERFQALPVGRVSGELPAGVAQVDNIYAFNLMTSLDQSGEPGQRLAQVTLSDFLARLARETAVAAAGLRTARWVYKPEIAVARPAGDVAASTASGPRFALVIDQFEEVITAHPGRWREREGFFRQLNQALLDDPNLWVVLSLREDYVASLDPYAELLFNRLRARFYMERMGVAAALDAIRKPAELGGRPFAADVAEQLVENLRQVRVPGQRDTVADQYVEPVQLQVVCYQLWEHLRGRPPGQISADDLLQAGDVDISLALFYESAIASVIGRQDIGVTEQQLRTWFSTKLITETGTRGIVFRNEQQGRTVGLPNAAVDLLVRQFLLRTEVRAGEPWVELVHDRFVEPILRANRARQTPLALDAEAWITAGRSPELFYEGQKLQDALRQVAQHPEEHTDVEREFLQAGLEEQDKRRKALRKRLQSVFSVLGLLIVGLAIVALVFALSARNSAEKNELLANTAATAAGEAMTAAAFAGAQEVAAINQKETAEAYRAIAIEALATSEANLQVALEAAATARAAQPSVTRLPQPPSGDTRTPAPSATLVGTATPNPTVLAQQTQLAEIQETRTALANPPSQELATTPSLALTATPTPTPTSVSARQPAGQIVFTSDRAGPANLGNLHIMDSNGRNIRQLTFASGFEPTYSWQRNSVAFTSFPSPGRSALFAINPSGGNPQSIDEQFWDNWEPSWAPSGSRLAFTSSRQNQDWEVWSMDVGGGNPVQLTNNDPGRSFSPSWSPDGRYIAFFSDRDDPGNRVEIWRMNADGTNQTRLTTGNHSGPYVRAWGLSWSPDSSQIVFPSNRDGNQEIYAMDVDGRNQRNLTRSTDAESSPVWSPDGQWIAFVRTIGLDQDILIMTIDGTNVTNLTQNPAQDWDPAWIP